MQSFSLESHGITVGRVLRNTAPALLYEEALRIHEQGLPGVEDIADVLSRRVGALGADVSTELRH